ncbi:RICIN domain-containing protein [Actinacidiphila paucisporea]|uniref:O-Glycosyl hydrolase n=1 Tax=Actinacidiphila paucisporea TaxID=310782 RepID=A0A1M6XS81_9ACTN|nr:RICIN domain-containing protein [Actinacidiphila paucisporea]SHL08758.1 O-Glycosyl hydrolase [Actinacidiphila paucisporea]
MHLRYPRTWLSRSRSRPRLMRGRRTVVAVTAVAAGALLAPGALVAAAGPAAAAAAPVQVYLSSESTAAGFTPGNGNWFTDPATGLAATRYQLSRQPDLTPVAASGSATITADTATRYQSVLGVGSSLEESTIYNLSRMSAAARTAALHKLVDPVNGAGFNVARIPLGTSDFTSRQFYTYDDGAADPSLSRFSIQKDIDYNIISVLKEAKAINPDLLLFGSVWSPPAWMKSNNSLIGGSLPDSSIPVLATYLRKAVTAYAGQGLPLYAVTMQNEPLFSPADYPGTTITADQERRIATALRGELNGNGAASTKIWAFDHNFSDGASYTAGVLGNPGSPSDAFDAVDGIAFHDYGGDPTTMSQVKANYPAKNVAMTERAVWGTSGADRIVQYFRNQSIMYEDWVTMLDQNRKPEQWSGSPDPTMLIQSPGSPDTYWALPEYYIIAQFSKFVARGATRVQTGNGSSGTVTNVAFLNPDGTLVTVVVNQTAAAQPFTLRAGGQQVSATLPAKTVGTYVWPATGGSPDTTAPSAPSNLTATASGTAVSLSWNASTDNVGVTGYQVFRGGAQVGTATGTSYTDSGLGASTAYSYTVRAADAAGNLSAASNTATVTTGSGGGSGPVDPTKWYTVKNTSSGKCVDDAAGSTANGAAVQQWACVAGSANQQWQFQATDSGYYKVVGRNSASAAWDVTGGTGVGNGAKIQLWAYGGGTNQQWKPVAASGGTYTLSPRSNTGQCLDVTDTSTADGARLQQWSCTGGPAQSFTLTAQ